MIRAGGARSDGRRFIVAGLTQENIERLVAGEPIKADLKTFGLDVDADLLILYGDTTEHIEQEFRKAGLIRKTTKIVDKSSARRSSRRKKK